MDSSFDELAVIDLDNDNSVYQPKPIDITPVLAFLGCTTSDKWLKAAMADLPTIIQDHANCEKSRRHRDEFDFSLYVAY